MFNLVAEFKPTGDQPDAIQQLEKNLISGCKGQVLLGVTGSGKTFVMANVIKDLQRPTLIISHNKTLAAQLYQEFRDFFPKNAVEYFVSYYDYYQPESYIPSTDTYIEKDADINEKIDKLRLSATTSLMTRKDVIVISSVSCIYNLGSPAVYSEMALELRTGMRLRMADLLARLTQVSYERSNIDFKRGTYRVTGDIVDVFPAYSDEGVRLELFNDALVGIAFFDPLTGGTVHKEQLPEQRRGSHTRAITQNPDDYTAHRAREGDAVMIYPAKHYIAADERREKAIQDIKFDLELRLKELRSNNKVLEAYRLEQRTNYDLEMMQEIGYCKGIENYSRYFDGREPGSTPYTLMDFFPKDYLLIVDESHITVPQVRGMFHGDRARKTTLVDYGFRLPSAMDNRPLNFNEFEQKIGQAVYVSATPDSWEISKSEGKVVNLFIRPTGITDPEIKIIPTKNQIEDLMSRIQERISRKERVLVTTLTKRMAEELASYLSDKKIKVTYLHSDIDTLERTNILDDLRKGNYDVLVGINLLREGLDLPEVSLVAILDADKEGFLRSETSLIQVMGRAARHILGQVVMYADNITGSMQRAIDEVSRRRNIQLEYNARYGIVPTQITKPIRDKLIDEKLEEDINAKKQKRTGVHTDIDYSQLPPKEIKREIRNMEKEMRYYAEMLNFEEAAILRDNIRNLYKLL